MKRYKGTLPLLLAFLLQLPLGAQKLLNGVGGDLSPHIVLIESAGEQGEGILITSFEPYLGQIFLVASLSAFTLGFESPLDTKPIHFMDTTVTVTHYFRRREQDALKEMAPHYGEVAPLKIQFNPKLLADSTNCITIPDSSDVVIIKLYDKDHSIEKRFVQWESIGALQPMPYDPKHQPESNPFQYKDQVVYIFSEHSEEASAIYLMDIEFAPNSKGRNFIPLVGTDYVSSVIFKLNGKRFDFYGIANKRLEVYEVTVPAIFNK